MLDCRLPPVLLQGLRRSRDTGLVPATSADVAAGTVQATPHASAGGTQLGRVAHHQVLTAQLSTAYIAFVVANWLHLYTCNGVRAKRQHYTQHYTLGTMSSSQPRNKNTLSPKCLRPEVSTW